MMATTATQGTVAGRPQPQTTAEPAGGPFIRHAPDGRRAMYVSATGFSGFMAPPMVSSPGWNKGYRCLVAATGGTGAVTAAVAGADAPFSFFSLVQMKDAFGTQLLTGPGYEIANLVPLYSGQFGTDLMRSPVNSPQFIPVNLASGANGGNFQFGTYFPFEFAKGYGVISGANAALLPVLQINTSGSASATTGSYLYLTAPGTIPTTFAETVDSDFYWLPNVPADPPGIGTTCQWIYQPCNPQINSSASQLVQLPRLGGYLTVLILELRNANGVRVGEGNTVQAGSGAATLDSGTGWPSRPKIVVDGVPLVDSLFTTLQEDLAITMGIGASNGTPIASATSPYVDTTPVFRPYGTMAISRKTSLAQRDFGLLDTGEIFLSTNPGTQLEIAGFPWGTVTTGPMTLNAIVGQIVPSGALVRGLPEA
jgi:hypothetical protein